MSHDSDLRDGYFALSENVNKVGVLEENKEGANSTLVPELELSMEDDELIALKKTWTKNWEEYAKGIELVQKQNESYWMGKQFKTADDSTKVADNLIFEALETFLPIATRPKAEPLVETDNTEEGNELADKVRKILAFHSDRLNVNLKMKQVTRYWALYLLGCMKVGWSTLENDITCKVIRPQKLILDPKGTIEDGVYTGYYIGEFVEDIASDVVARFPNKEKEIKDKVKDKMGTSVQYLQWWTNEYVFWTLDDIVLDKKKNPHWNYDSTETESRTDEFGIVTQEEVPNEGNNHLNMPQMPYIFLSIFNLGNQPHDSTSLIQQNLSLQDLINKRLLQIDKNADNTNNGLIVSGDAFTEEQANNIGRSLRKGGVVWVPTGDVNNSVKRDTGTPLAPFVYESLVDYRNELRNIFGTRGSTPQGTIGEQTATGKGIIKGQDTDRIGGGVSTYLEQFTDQLYNWFTQLMYVYYDEPHLVPILGVEKTKEYLELQNDQFDRKLLVGVKEGSMIPKDPQSERIEALELWAKDGIDPVTFFDKLDFPNPKESAKQLFLWKSDPIQLFPELMQEQQQQQLAQQQAEQEQQAQEQREQQEQMQIERANKDLDHENDLQKIELREALKEDTESRKPTAPSQ